MKLRSGTTYNEPTTGRRAPTRNRVVKKTSTTTRTPTPPLRRSARLRKRRR